MADAHINLIRNSRVFISTVNDPVNMKHANTYELNVLDGFSFTQTTATAEITLFEAGTDSNRGKKSYNTARNPVDWSFTTYIRPYKRTAGTTPTAYSSAVEKLLWEALLTAGATVSTPDNTIWTPFASFTEGLAATGMTGDTSLSNKDVLLPLYIYFELSDQAGTANKTYYRINKALVNTAEIDFSIDGIAQIAWSGQGETLEEVTQNDTPLKSGTLFMPASGASTGTLLPSSGHGIGATANAATQKIFQPEFIRNKLSTVVLQDKNGGTYNNKYYKLVLTGGSISIDNGITYLTPDELGVVNTPIGGFTGTRSISGSMSCYLRAGGTGATYDGSTDANGFDSATLISHLLAATTQTDNTYKLIMNMGGTTAPMVEFVFDQAQLEVPAIDVADVISTSINFVAEGSSMTAVDILDVTYKATVT
jgi:hypothetical protein